MRTPTLAVTTLFLLAASSAYAQQVSYYSYGVADDNNAYAWAVIDDGGMYGEIHAPGQSASLRSPSGRTTGVVSSRSYRIDLSLPLAEESGNFTITSYHSLYCTYLGWILYQVSSAYAIDVPRRFKLTTRAFIPPASFGPTPLTCYNPGLGENIPMIFRGDNRGFDPSPSVTYRAQTQAVVEPNRGRLVGAVHFGGISKAYAIYLEDDGVLNDCWKWDTSAQVNTSGLRVSAWPVATRTVRSSLIGSAQDALVFGLAPNLDWDYTLDISNFNPAAPGFTIQGIHDCYPAYEFYLNNTQGIYGYLPPRNDFNYATNCLYAWFGYNPIRFGPYSGQIN
jgi:hypothetical protein